MVISQIITPLQINILVQKETINLKDNTTLSITTFQSKSGDAPTLLIYPAFGVKATYYKPFAEKLIALGINVVTADLRGHGLSSVRPNAKNNYGFLEMTNDLKAVSDYLKQENPTSKIYILGHSFCLQIKFYSACHLIGEYI